MTMFARSALTVWDNATTGGWSNASGGADNGLVPTSADNVVFDASSGPARTIVCDGSGACNNLTTVGANAMVFSTSTMPISGNADLSGMTSAGIQFVGSGARTLKGQSVAFGNVTCGASTTLTLLSDMSCSSLSYGSTSTFNANGFNVTIPAFLGSGFGSLTLGSGVWTLTGTGTIFTPASTTITTGSTIKITDTSATLKSFSGTQTYNNLVVSGGGAGFGVGTTTFNNVTLAAGASLTVSAGATLTVASLTADGTGAPITIKSFTSGSAAGLTKSGGGTVYVDYCSIKDITASPGSTFFARNSTNVSGNTNWTFIPGNSRFMAFF